MNIHRIATPKMVWTGCAVGMGAWLFVRLSALSGWSPRRLMLESSIKLIFLSAAFFLAFLLNLRIAGEHRQSPWMRLAWLALAGNAAFSLLRVPIESAQMNLVWENFSSSSLFGLIQHLAIVPANACLVVGLFAMGWAYHQLGLGFRIETRGYLAMIGVLGLMLGLLYFRAGLSQARSPYLASRWLQLIGLVLLSLSAAASIILHRMAVQMGGGKLALALRCLTLYTLLRAVLVLIEAWRRTSFPEGGLRNDVLPMLLNLGWQIVPWFALLAAVYRAELTTHAARELAQHRAAKAALASA